jgi:integrase/recombinase XerC
VQSFLSYLEYEKRYSPHTISGYTSDLEQFSLFLKLYEKENIAEATHIDIRNWIVSMMEQKISPRSINRKISVLKSLFKFLMRRGDVKRSPLQNVQTPKTSKRLPVFVEQTGIDKLLENVTFPDGFEGALDKLMIEVFYGTGMRRSELAGLKETDIDSYNSQVKVLGKGNKERIIPIHPKLRNSILQFIQLKHVEIPQQEGNFLFVNTNGNRLKPEFIYSTIKKYLSLVTTVDKKSPHVLRHTFATHLMNSGADINAVKELLGHSSLAATQVYTHNTIDKLKDIYRKAHPKA